MPSHIPAQTHIIPVSLNAPRSRHRRARVSGDSSKPRKNVAGRRLQMKNITNTPVFNPDLPLPEAEHLHNTPMVSTTQNPFTLPALSFSLEREFWEIHDIRLHGGTCQSPRTHPPSWTDIKIRSVTHPNSPYVPWSEDQRQCILASTDTLGATERITSDDIKEWVKVSGPEPAPPLALPRASYTRRVLNLILKCLRSLYSPLHIPPPTHTPVTPPFDTIDDSVITLSSIQSTSLEDWLAERQLWTTAEDVATNASVSLDEYERNGSWVHQAPSTDVTGPNQDLPRTFSLDCIPSPSPTIISFPCFT